MLKAKKSLSQNFLIDQNICKKIIKQSNINDNIVLEIGPGYGFLTDFILAKKPKKLFLVEKDNNLKKILKNKYELNKNVFFIDEDILKIDLKFLKNIIIISNLPYNISTKIILHLFKYNMNILEMIVMIQKEVAEKFDYNLVNMNKYKFLTKLVSDYQRCFDVSPHVFVPKPKVNSSVVKFKFKDKFIDFNKANSFTKMIFKNIRKKINNNLDINYENKLLNKRVNELTISELLRIYNFF